MVKELSHTTNQTCQYYLQGVVRMIQLKMIVHVLSYRIEIKINLTRKKSPIVCRIYKRATHQRLEYNAISRPFQ